MQAKGVSLSNELWGAIFIVLHRDTLAKRVRDASYSQGIPSIEDGRPTYLRLVCKRFKTVFDCVPELSECLILRRDLDSTQEPALLTHIQRKGSCKRLLYASCNSPLAEAGVAALLGRADGLKEAVIMSPTFNLLNIMSGFHSLHKCELSRSTARSRVISVSLHALAALPNLTTLTLSGSFVGIQHLCHLTELNLRRATINLLVGQAQAFELTKSLQKLTLTCSRWFWLAGGLTACTALQTLRCARSIVTEEAGSANNLDVLYEGDTVDTPVNFTNMTHLTELYTQTSSSNSNAEQHRWWYCLSSLVHLKLQFVDVNCGELDDKLTLLHHLKSLHVHASKLRIDLSWQNMFALQEVEVNADFLTVSEHIMGFCCAQSLHKLRIGCDEAEEASCELLCTLVRRLAAQRPQVCCQILGKVVSSTSWQVNGVFLSVDRDKGLASWVAGFDS